MSWKRQPIDYQVCTWSCLRRDTVRIHKNERCGSLEYGGEGGTSKCVESITVKSFVRLPFSKNFLFLPSIYIMSQSSIRTK